MVCYCYHTCHCTIVDIRIALICKYLSNLSSKFQPKRRVWEREAARLWFLCDQEAFQSWQLWQIMCFVSWEMNFDLCSRSKLLGSELTYIQTDICIIKNWSSTSGTENPCHKIAHGQVPNNNTFTYYRLHTTKATKKPTPLWFWKSLNFGSIPNPNHNTKPASTLYYDNLKVPPPPPPLII